MSNASLKPCQYPGCRCYAVKGSSYCADHVKRVKRSKYRSCTSSAALGYGSRWQKASKLFLMEHPLCAECERQGRVTPATEVDHIVPHKGDMDIFWDQDNWQALCHQCHSRKTAKEDGGFGRTPRGDPKY